MRRDLTEPSRPHFFQKRLGDFQARGVADYAVDPALGAHGRLLRAGLIRISPIDDLIWTKDLLAIEATALLASFNFCTIKKALLVSDSQRMVLG